MSRPQTSRRSLLHGAALVIATLLLQQPTALAAPSSQAAEQEPLGEMVRRGLSTAAAQAAMLYGQVEGLPGQLPRTYEGGVLLTTDYHGWVCGFFPGLLWQLYEADPQGEGAKFLPWAEEATSRVEKAAGLLNTHDLGFMLYCSYGHKWRDTSDPHAMEVLERAGASLRTRWNPSVGCMMSWDPSGSWRFPVIVDNLMNLELLCFLARQTGDRSFLDMATRHADTTLRNHYRSDWSCFHVVSYDPATGAVGHRQTAQGYSDASAWARGQAWGLYGYTMLYRETLQQRYLDAARNIAAFLTGHPQLPEDRVPYWDYDVPDKSTAPRDASSAAIMASALLELSELDPGPGAARWRDEAVAMLRSLSSPRYLAEPGANGGFVLMHGVGSKPADSEVDVPLSYADYYYVEALLRLRRQLSGPTGGQDRAYWVDQLTRIADPVLTSLAEGRLAERMPFESLASSQGRVDVSRLEAFGRTICGIAPWLELGPDDSPEGQLRAKYIDLARRALAAASDPESPDRLYFHHPTETQPLVDVAFLAEALLRAPGQLWHGLDQKVRDDLVGAFVESRLTIPYESNWLLFASTIEAALLEFTGTCDMRRLTYGVRRFMDDWYKGDGWYGDGPAMHFDYYNSLVIHPMLTEVLAVMARHGLDTRDELPIQRRRIGRYAAQLEKLVSPEGTFPAVGRSICYRSGCLHALADAALLHLLPEDTTPPAAVRCAMTAVLRNQFSVPGTFDKDGWLRVGFTGSQLAMSESYINTGSVYLCTAFFLPLGLPETDPFWSAPARPWTARRAWSGAPVAADHAL